MLCSQVFILNACCNRTLEMASKRNTTQGWFRGLPGGPVVKNPPCNAGDSGSIPGGGTKIPHAAEQLSPWATPRKTSRCNGRSCVPQLRPDTAKLILLVVVFTRSVMCETMWPHGLQHTRLLCPSLPPGVCSNSCRVGDAIQPSHPLSSPSPPAFSLSQHQGLFQWISSSPQAAKILELQLHRQSFQWIFRVDFL